MEALDTDSLCRGPVTLNQLRDRAFVITKSKGGSFQVFTEACERQGFKPKVFLECDDYTCRRRALLSGVCLGLNLGKQDENATNTQFLSITDFHEEFFMNVYYKKERCEGKVELFLDMLKGSASML